MAKKYVESDEPRTLLQELALNGKVTAHSQVQMAMARKYFVKEGKNTRQIQDLVAIPQRKLDKWVLLFGWEEERDKYTYSKYRKVANVARRKGIDVDARADRIMGTIESVAERMLQNHLDDEASGETDNLLSPKELAVLAACVKTTHGQRRIATGRDKVEKTEHTVAFLGKVDILHRVGHAMVDASRSMPQLETMRAAQITAKSHELEDVEYEVSDEHISEDR